MNKLWAPWRSKYVSQKKRGKCIFCIQRKKNNATDRKKYILHRDAQCFSMLNLYPYNNGHIMVAPYRHVSNIDKLTQTEISGLMNLIIKTRSILNDKLAPDGYNIGVNEGKAAGAGFSGHIHFHIVPRWTGDTNFMPVCSSNKVISQSLIALYEMVKNAYTQGS